MAINHNLFYLQGRKILWKLWVSNKTPWVVLLKCVIHYETVHRGTVQCLGKINIFFYYYFLTLLAEKTWFASSLWSRSHIHPIYAEDILYSQGYMEHKNESEHIFSPLLPIFIPFSNFQCICPLPGAHFINDAVQWRWASAEQHVGPVINFVLLVAFSQGSLLTVTYSLSWKHFWESKHSNRSAKPNTHWGTLLLSMPALSNAWAKQQQGHCTVEA